MRTQNNALIRAVMESSNMPLANIAREVGISTRHLRRIQSGERRCSLDLKLKILHVTGAPVVAGLLTENVAIDHLVKTYVRYLDDFVTTMLPLLSDLANEDALDPHQARNHAVWFAEQLRIENRRRHIRHESQNTRY